MAGQLLYIKSNKKLYKKDNEYYTPKKIVDYFGSFDYDPATVKEKAEEFNIKNYDTIETDGLIQDWSKYKRIWCNPPFTIKFDFLKKAVETYNNNKDIEIYILLTIESLATKKFRDTMKDVKMKLFIPAGRINFESGIGKKGKSPAFGSCIIKLQDKYEIEILNMEVL